MAGQKQYEMEYKLSANLAGSFSSTFSKAQNALNETQEKLKALAQEQSDIAAYSKQQAAVEKSAQKLELLKKKLENVSQEYTETGSKSSTLANRMLDYENSIDKTNSALQKQEAELHEMESALTAAGVDTKNLGSESERLEQEMDELTATEKEAQASAEEFGDAGEASFQGVGEALAAAGIVVGLKKIYDGFKDVITVAADFEAEMSYVEALSGGTGDEMAALSEKAKAMGAATKYTAQESASAFSYMALAGWDTESMLAGIEPVLNLAAAANMDLATASDIVTDYLTAFGLTADDTAGFVDQMAYAMSHSNTDVEQLGEAYKACAATSKSLGYSVEETTAILMAMANAGVKGGEAGTALNAIMTRLATDTKGCASALEEYGVHVYDAEGNMQSLSSLLTGTAAVFGNLTDQEQANLAKMIAGTNQYSKFQTIMAGCGQEAIASGQSFTDYAEALQNCNGAATEMADTMLNNMSGRLTILTSAWEGLTIAVGEEFTPALSDVFDAATEVLGIATDFVQNNPALVRAIGYTVTGLGSALAVITAIAAAKKAAAAIDLAAMFTSPVGAAIALTGTIAGLAAAVVSLNDEYESYTEKSDELNENLQTLDSNAANLKATHAENVEANEAEAASTTGLINRLGELVAAYDGTEASAVEINEVIAQLNSAVPGLDLSFDSLSGSINKTADEIIGLAEAAAASDALIEAMKHEQEMYANYDSYADEAAKALTAYQQQYLAVQDAALDDSVSLDDFGKMQDELVNLGNAYTTASEARDNAYKDWQDSKVELSDAKDKYNELTGSIDESTDATKANSEASGAGLKKMLQLKYAAEMVADGTMDAALAAKAYGLSTDELNDYIDKQDAKQSNLEAALQAVEQGYLDAETAAERYGVTVDDIDIERYTEKLTSLCTAYQAAYESAYESMNGQFDLWDKADEVTSTSMSKLQSNLDSQITYWQNYNSNLATISAAAQEHGIDISGIWDHLSDGSPEAVAAVQGIAEAINTNTQSGVDALQTYSDSYNTLQETIGATADTIAQGTGEVQDAWAEFWTAASEGFDDSELQAKFLESGQNVIKGFVDGLGDGTEVSTQLTTQANSWLDAFNAALGVHSPSTITLESGQNTIQGFVNGVDGYASNASSAMEYAANSAITAFKSQMNVTTLYTAGQNAIQGAINGISSMIPSLIAKAASAGSQAAQAYKDAQDINSPSKVFEYYGRMDMLGAIQGIEKTQQKANDTFEAAGLANAAAYQSAISEESGLATLYADQQQAILADIPGVLAQARGAMTVQDAAPLPDAGGMTIYYSPTYNISGNQDSSSIREVLAAHDSEFRADLKDFIVETMNDHEVDMVRRSIR